MAEKLPAMPLYIGDWDKDPIIKMMSPEDEGIYLRILRIMWESDKRGYLILNGGKFNTEELAIMLRLDKQKLEDWLNKYQDRYRIFGVCCIEGVLFSRKHVRIMELSEKRKSAGKQGGNPNLVNQKSSKRLSKNSKLGYPNAEDEIENEYEDEDNKKKKMTSRDRVAMSEVAFAKFWAAYPKRDGKQDALKAWRKIPEAQSDPEFITRALEALARQKQSPGWTKDGGQFIPRASTWLNGRRWEDEGVVGLKPQPPGWAKRYTDAMLPLDGENDQKNVADFFDSAVEVQDRTTEEDPDDQG
jgi:hypothetical protein